MGCQSSNTLHQSASPHSKEALKSLAAHFPTAMKGHDIEARVFKQLHKLGFTDENTLFAEATCPDEVNHDDPKEDITALFQRRWGEVFPLGGLAGLPFTGKTGWAAFSSHCPKDGNITILFAPHVGLDREGRVGKIYRDG